MGDEVAKAAAPPVPDELNEPQALAAGHHDGPLLIFAGAGSGKTRVIVYRIAALVAIHRVPPHRILAVTFTNKAASEMNVRLGALLGEDVAKDLWVGTFHSICVRLLRRYHEAAGLGQSFVIYDDGDQRTIAARAIREVASGDQKVSAKALLSKVSALKQEGKVPSDVDPKDPLLRAFFESYQKQLSSSDAVDFDDILTRVLTVLEDPGSQAGKEVAARFRHVLVDEFQDVNQVQYRLVRALSADTRNLCVVGDDDQSIYRWRGADVRIVRNFREDFPDAEVIKLEQNYRSTGNVVKSALGVIKPAQGREPKELWTANRDGDPVCVVSCEDERDEAAFVVARVKEAVAAGTRASDVAVFYRTHAQSRAIEEAMLKARVPYQIVGGTRFFDRAEVKDALSYLRAISNPYSSVDVLRIINVPPRRIGDATIERIRAGGGGVEGPDPGGDPDPRPRSSARRRRTRSSGSTSSWVGSSRRRATRCRARPWTWSWRRAATTRCSRRTRARRPRRGAGTYASSSGPWCRTSTRC